MSTSSSPAQAGWGHRWGHHGFYGGYYGGSLGWGYPGYRFSSFYVSRPRLFHPYRVGYYSSYYVPSVSYSVSLPTYYYATPTYYVAPTYYSVPTYYSAPVVYPSCCDPCASSVISPSVSYPSNSPTYSEPEYSTGVEPQSYVQSPQFAGAVGGSFVDRMLSRSTTASASTPTPLRTNFITASTSDGSVRTVSTLKPVASSVASNSPAASLESLSPIPAGLLKTADEMFALGGYQQAASAYARLAVRYGDHDELAVRRFIALIASGDHAQASIVYELAMVNGRPLLAQSLPVGGLAKLYGASGSNRKNHIESLAGYALNAEGEALPLRMVGTWLQLDGQADRAATFLKRADLITNPIASPVVASTVASRLADGQFAR